tara:strand:- start:204 stop:476 length:273 start_codon:yes stop_codon:yes gene_type:complete
MAKRKKSRAHQESKGERRNVAKSTRKQMRDAVTPLTIMSNKMKAWRAGKNVIVTIPNPNKKETNKKFIKVNAKEVWGSPKKFIMKQMASE